MPEAQMRYIGGVEGGGTKSTMILMNTAGEVLAESHGPTLNQWLIGLNKACVVLNDLVNDCKQQAGIPRHTRLTVLGIAVSGSDSKQSQIDMESYLHTHYPTMAHQYVISSDTIGSIATAFSDGGMAIISGTGSNCEVVNPDGSAYKVGGWGHMLADKGSAYWISHYCIRKVFEVDDNFHYSDGAQDVTRVKQIMLKYFNIKDRTGLLESTYASFEKCRFAGMCKHISECAINTGDALCIEAFNIAGRDLARHIISILPRLNQSLVHREGGIQVVCVGSVWNSWQLLKTGFLAAIDGSPITELTLYLLDKPSSHGAAAMGAKGCNVPLHMDYSKRQEVTRQDDCDDMMQHIPDGGVLCLVSKIPFFDFSFTLLDLLRRNLAKAPAILERINRAGMAKLAHGVEVSDLLGSPRVLGLRAMTQRMPRELLSKGCDWSQLGNLTRHESSSPLAHTLARWQGWWGLLTLLMRWGDRLLEEVILKLLPCVLLEQQVVLFGDAQRTCVVAFLLRGMLWPFKWQHLFVCAPWPPEELQNVPLVEAPFPFIFAFGETAMLQHFWGYQNMYDLPENIVACLLRDRWVVINEKLKTSGGLTGKTLKFPPFVHSELRSQIKEARSALRNQHGLLEIVQKVQDAIEAAMGKLANIVNRYAQSQVEAEAARSKAKDVDDLYERSCQRAENEERFLAWLHKEPAFGSVEQAAFYKSFYQTQCFMHRMYEEIHSQADAWVLRNC